MNATQKAIRDGELVLSEERLNKTMQAFISNWAPQDEHTASYFNAELHALVRAVYADMQRPVATVFENVLMSNVMNPYLVKGKIDE